VFSACLAEMKWDSCDYRKVTEAILDSSLQFYSHRKLHAQIEGQLLNTCTRQLIIWMQMDPKELHNDNTILDAFTLGDKRMHVHIQSM
jgi:hypothetical protein